MIKMIKGDLIEMAKKGRFDVIAHGCNCFCNMGAGIAAQIKKEFPRAFDIDCATTKGDMSKLGAVTVAEYDRVHIVNAYTQFQYGRDKRKKGKPNVDYDAIRSCMRWICENYTTLEIGLPLIGCGLAGGDWGIVEQIIEEEFLDENVTIVVFDK